MDCCPVCKENSKKKILCKVNLIYGVEHDLVECQNCKVIHYAPVPTAKELGVFYSAIAYEFDRWKHEAKARAFTKNFLKEKKNGRFLDVGCASGYFINGIRKYSKWDVFGVDVGKKPIQFAQEVLSLDARESDIINAGFSENYFDFVHISDVLEHVNNPVETLVECHRIIKSDGTLFLSIPNGSIDCLDLVHFYKDKKRPGRQYSGHIYFFPKQTLLNIFEEIGFDVISAETFHFKRGLRSLGFLPKKLNWANRYEPSKLPEKIYEGEVALLENKKHSDFYYDIQESKKKCFRVPGLLNVGLNFRFLLKPKNQPS